MRDGDGGMLARSRIGAAQLGVIDVLTALALLAILLYASWKQFPAYGRHREAVSPPAAQGTPQGALQR